LLAGLLAQITILTKQALNNYKINEIINLINLKLIKNNIELS
tara:strand:- start:1806 stop:1931 length:126 start_codon:yes stop_codon:yes gene_type:complete